MASEKCAPDDPRRCVGVTMNGQCEYLAVEGRRFCDFHSNGAGSREEVRQAINKYIIEREELNRAYTRRNNELDYLDLKDDINLLHGMLERRLNMAKNEAEEMAAYRDAQGIIQRLESMKISLMKIQQQMGLVLGKDQLRVLAKQFAAILNEGLDGIPDKEDRMELMMERLFTAIEDAGRQREE